MVINYFPHDSNARSDNKVIALRMKYGWEGYGLYWAIVEKLRDSTGYSLADDCDAIAYDLRADSSTVRSIIDDFGLFARDPAGHFSSPSLLRRMEVKDERSARSREAANARWQRERSSRNASAPEPQSGVMAGKESKQEETKQKETKDTLCITPRSPKAAREETERAVFEVFLQERGFPQAREETIRLLDYYDSRGWRSGTLRITNPAAAARLWDVRSKAAPLAQGAASTLRALYETLSAQEGFSWRDFTVTGGRYDPQEEKLLLCCSRALGDRARECRDEILRAVDAAGGTGFRLIYTEGK